MVGTVRFLLFMLVVLPFGLVTAQKETEETVDTSSWVLFEAESAYLFAPENWLDMTSPDLMEVALEEAGNVSPELGAYVELAQSMALSMDLEFYLIDPVSAANVNLVIVDLGFAPTLDFLERDIATTYGGIGAEIIELSQVRIGDLEAVRAQAVLPFAYPAVGQIQYMFIDGTRVFVLTFTSDEGMFDEYKTTFDAIAVNFGVGVAPPDLVVNSGDAPIVIVESQGQDVPGDSDELVLYQGEATYLYATSNWVDVRNSGLAQNIPYDAQASDILLLNLVNGANLNVAVGDMGQAMTLEELEFSILGEYRNLGLAVIDIQPVELLDGTGLRAEALLRQSAQESLTLLQYSIMQDTTLYVLTFTTGARFFSQLQPEFDSIGLTLGIGEAPSEDD